MNKYLKAWQDDLLDPLNDILARWLLLLGMVDARKKTVYKVIYKELEELAMKDENLQEELTLWENMSQTPETMYAYESRLKYMLDEEAKYVDTLAKGKKEGREEGIAEGKEKGLTEGIEIGKEEGRKEGKKEGIERVAQNMIAKGKSNEDIMDATNLTSVEIEALRKPE